MKEREFRYALRYGNLDEDEKIRLQEEWLEWERQHPERYGYPLFHTNAMDFPFLFTITHEDRPKAMRLQWGLIPADIKDREEAEKRRRQTLNARGETIFEKISYRESARERRCLIMVDGFFDYHHKKGNAIPHFIRHKEEDTPLIIAGLWGEWADPETGEIFQTVSMVTTLPNELMTWLHNNPKRNEPRMPLILEPRDAKNWLESTNQEEVQRLIQPYPDELMMAYPVAKLKGKHSVQNDLSKIDKKYYPELDIQGELF